MAEKIKYSRKDLKSPDEFITSVGRATAWMQVNRTVVVAACVVVVVALAGIVGARAYIGGKEARASREIWPVLGSAAEYLRTPDADGGGEGARLEQSLSALLERHAGTEAAVYAQYYLGSIAYRRGDYDESAARFRSAIGEGEEGTVMEYLLRLGLAQALESAGHLDESRIAYGEAAERATGALRAQALMGQARTLAALARPGEAAEVLRRILAENPDTPYKDLIQIRLAHLE